MRIASLVVTLVAATGTTAAIANDSTGHLAAGGLVLSRTADIEMRQEELFVSAKEIRVRYRFFNKSNADIKTQVGFPMPDLPPRSDEENYVVPNDDPVNFLGFSTEVNSKPVAMLVEQRAVAGGVDQTALLKGLNVPLSPFQDATQTAVRALPRAQQEKLLTLGLAREEEYDIGQGMQKYLEPNWTLRTTYHWEQTFPAQKELIVEHRYQPSVGATAGSFVATGEVDSQVLVGYETRYCVDDVFLDAALRAQKALKAKEVYLMEQRLEYILTTGANWAGPIKDFRLVVDKGSPNNLVSFCGTDVKKIGPTQFEVRAKDYTPTQNLNVLILTRAAE